MKEKRGMLRRLGLGAITIGLLSGSPALAQEAAPPLLIVPGLSQGQQPRLHPVPQPRPQPQETLQIKAEVDRAPSGISVSGLADVNPEAVGLLSRDPSKPWERDLGASLWYGATQDNVLHRISALPAASSSPAVRALTRQILLTAAVPSRNGGEESARGILTAARMDKLLQAGLAEDALRLAEALPQNVVTEPVDLARMRALWMAGNIQSACSKADDGADAYTSTIWVKIRTACAVLGGKVDKAQLSLAVLDELQAIDAGFTPIANRILGKELSLSELPPSMDMAEVAAFVAMGGKLPEDLPLREKPWLVRFAIPANGPISDGHLVALEFGMRRGVLGLAEAEAVYARVKLAKEEIKAAEDLSAAGDTPRQRLAYYRAFLKAAPKVEATVKPEPEHKMAEVETVSPAPPQISAAQIEIAAKLMQAARLSPQDSAVVAVLLAKPLAQMAESPLAAWLADDAIRLALWSGDWEIALKWADLAKQNSGASEKAQQAMQDLAPILTLVDVAKTAQMRSSVTLPPMASSWAMAEQTRGLKADQIAQMRDRLFGLYRVFSLNVDSQDWQVAVSDNVQPYPVLTVSPVAVAAARDAAMLGARGLALSGVAHQMGNLVTAGGASASPIAVESLVDILLQVGAVDWAKRIAVETLLAAGA